MIFEKFLKNFLDLRNRFNGLEFLNNDFFIQFSYYKEHLNSGNKFWTSRTEKKAVVDHNSQIYINGLKNQKSFRMKMNTGLQANYFWKKTQKTQLYQSNIQRNFSFDKIKTPPKRNIMEAHVEDFPEEPPVLAIKGYNNLCPFSPILLE